MEPTAPGLKRESRQSRAVQALILLLLVIMITLAGVSMLGTTQYQLVGQMREGLGASFSPTGTGEGH